MLAVQQALIDLGFLSAGMADGRMGPSTRAAVSNFQRSAARFDCDLTPSGELDARTLAALERLSPPPGSSLASFPSAEMVPARTFEGTPVRVVVCLAEHRTFLFNTDGSLAGVFPNASGAPSTPTHTGLRVVNRHLSGSFLRSIARELWHDPGVFGEHMLDLSYVGGRRSGEELHGTSSPASIGRSVSHGCMRHDRASIAALYAAVRDGDRVAIVDSIDDPRLGGAPRSTTPPLPPRTPSITPIANLGPLPPPP